MTDSEKKNEILRLTLKVDKPCGPNRIREHLYPDKEYSQELKDSVIDLMHQMQSEKPDVANYNLFADSETIASNSITKPFLDKGGFVEAEKIANRAAKKAKNGSLLSNWNVIRYWILFIVSIVVATITVIEFIERRPNDKSNQEPEIEVSKKQKRQLTDTVSASKQDSLSTPSSSDKHK